MNPLDDPGAMAVARHRAYALFGEAFVHGAHGRVRPRLVALPAVADVLRASATEETLAAEHHTALSLHVFPFASSFLDPDGLLGGDVSRAVGHAYADGGFRPDTAALAPDHVGLQLAYLAHLGASEAEALAHAPERVPQLRDLQRAFLDRHLLRWLPVFVLALEQQSGSALWGRVARLSLELAAGHRLGLGEPAPLAPLPASSLSLDDAETRLRDIVQHLTVPARSGWFLSRRGMAAAAQAADVPAGFGPRHRLLEQALHAAIDHRRQDAFVGALRRQLETWSQGLRGMSDLGLDLQMWHTPASHTAALLAEVGRAATLRNGPGDGDL